MKNVREIADKSPYYMGPLINDFAKTIEEITTGNKSRNKDAI